MIKELKAIAADINILYVEDEDEVRNVAYQLLKKFFKNVVVGVDGEDGLDKYQNHGMTFDIVLTDISMPKMNGLDMAELIKAINPNQHLMIASAHSDSMNLLKAIEIGVEYFIIKPIDNTQLFEALIRVCKRVLAERKLDELQFNTLKNSVDKAIEIKFEKVLHSIPIPSVLLDSEDHALYFNEEFLNIFDMFEDNETIFKINEKSLKFTDILDEESEYLVNAILDWKDEVIDLQDNESCNFVLNTANKQEFTIKIKKFEEDSESTTHYLLCLLAK
ncbi:MAG: response regulator [Helicobacteraceae bacterium]|nr:response regulator [Helicobacteraceae bacterium]